jgi:sortase A
MQRSWEFEGFLPYPESTERVPHRPHLPPLHLTPMSTPPVFDTRRQARQASRRRSRGAKALGVTGEILLTAGVLVQLFWLWQVGVNDWLQGWNQSRAASEISQQWREEALTSSPAEAEIETDTEEDVPADPTDDSEVAQVAPASTDPPILDSVATGSPFATLYVPRFGENYQRVIAEGVDLATVLNSERLGIGHYEQSNALGELGNVALAAHRNSNGAPFGKITELRLGDRLYVETRDGWYSYVFRNHEYVRATEIAVLNPIPKVDDIVATDRLLTLTSCHPLFSTAERVIAYAVFDGWYPRESGPPSEIAHLAGVT